MAVGKRENGSTSALNRSTLPKEFSRGGWHPRFLDLERNRLVVVIPTLNEIEGIGDVIDELKAHGYEKILVVDGGSTDGTVEAAMAKGVRVIFQEGKGKANAIRTALKYIDSRFMAVMDGDFTYPAGHLDELFRKALEGYDEVIGSRIYEEGTQNLIYKIGNRILTKFFNLLFGTNLRDVLSGMYVVRLSALSDAFFEMRGFSVESEIAAHIASTSQRIAEVPIRYRRRKGKKKLKVRHGVAIAINMLKLAWRYNPSFTIFVAGTTLMVPGLILGGYAAYHYFFTGIKYYVKGLIGIFLVLAGFNSLLLAIMSIYLKRFEMRINRKLEDLTRQNLNET